MSPVIYSEESVSIKGAADISFPTITFNIKATLTGNTVTEDGLLKAEIVYEASLDSYVTTGLFGQDPFEYSIQIYGSDKELILEKEEGVTSWTSEDYSGTATVLWAIAEDGTVPAWVQIKTSNPEFNSYYGDEGRTIIFCNFTVPSDGSPSPPTHCEANSSVATLGNDPLPLQIKYCNGDFVQYRYRFTETYEWGDWTDWTDWPSLGQNNVVFPLGINDYAYNAIQFRSYNYDESYSTPRSEYTESEIVQFMLERPSDPVLDKTEIIYGETVTAVSTHGYSKATIEYSWNGPDGFICYGQSCVVPKSNCWCEAWSHGEGFLRASDDTNRHYGYSLLVTVTAGLPTNLSCTPNPVPYGESMTPTCTAVDGCVPEIQLTNDAWETSTNDLESFKAVGPYVSFAIRLTREGCNSSEWVFFDKPIYVILPPPTCSCPGQVLYGDSVNLVCGTEMPDAVVTFQSMIYNTTGSETECSQVVVINKTGLQFRCMISKEGMYVPQWSAWTSPVLVKFPKPSCSVNPMTITVEESAEILSVCDRDLPSEAVTIYQYTSDGGLSWVNCESPFKMMQNGLKFRSYVTSSVGYVDSDYSEVTDPVTVNFEPRSMKSNGFILDFIFEDPTTPKVEVYATWNEFPPRLALGRFNYYTLELLSYVDGHWEVSSIVSGSNSPTSTSVASEKITISNTVAGRQCKLRLTCYYQGDVRYGPQETGQFESAEFSVSGYPDGVVLLYPNDQEFSTCNSSPRLIFRVSCPDYYEDTSIHDISIIDSIYGTYTFKNNRDRFRTVTGQIQGNTIPSGTFVVFLCEPSEESRNFKIRYSSAYLDSEDPVLLNCEYVSIPYVVKGDKILESQRLALHEAAYKSLKSYSKINGSWSLTETANFKFSVILRSFFESLLTDLKTTYDSVISKYAPPADSKISIDEIDLSPNLEITADDSGSESRSGNYFNDVLYILKNML